MAYNTKEDRKKKLQEIMNNAPAIIPPCIANPPSHTFIVSIIFYD